MSEITDKENIKILGIVAAVGIIGIVLMYIAAMSPFQSIGKGEAVDLVGGATKKAECSDKKDNDGDRKIDYPNDKGCSSKSDTTENSESQTTIICGNKICESGETYVSCSIDCKTPCIESWQCSNWDTCISNSQHRLCQDQNNCGTMNTKPQETQTCTSGSVCGNKICESGESSSNCGKDCSPICGNSLCESGETYVSCSIDCKTPCIESWQCSNWDTCISNSQHRLCQDQNNCGTMNTKPQETQTCTSGSVCGNKICESGESSSNCGKDCSPICGNSLCEYGESSKNCASDCGTSQTAPPTSSVSSNNARVEIQHTFIGDLYAIVGVGNDPLHYQCAITVTNRQGGSIDDIRRDIDLSPCANYLPPSSTNPWFLYVEDRAAYDEGQIEVFRITTGGQTYTANGLPIPIRDFSSATATIRGVISTLHSSILPTSRSVQVGQTATAFATILASGTGTARRCGIAPLTSIPASFSFQTTDPTTNQVTGTPNTPVDIQGGSGQSFVISLTPTAQFATDVKFSFDCDNTEPAPILSGVNTLLFIASSTPVPDIIALAATPSNDGILNIPVNGAAAFSIATSNVGASATITAQADTGIVNLPLTLSICETNPANAQCKSPPSSSVSTQIDSGATPTFSVFASTDGVIPFDPANNRIFVRFRTSSDGVIRGSTSVAVRTQ